MSSAYVLLITSLFWTKYGYTSVHVATQEFTSRETCLSASEALLGSIAQEQASKAISIRTRCVPK